MMVYAEQPKDIDPDALRTPFVLNKNTGNWGLFIIKDKVITWGHRFDPGIGYRVYVKFQDSVMINCFTPEVARKTAVHISRNEKNEDILNLGIVLKQTANEVEKLNKAWAGLGAPDVPLHEIKDAGNA